MPDDAPEEGEHEHEPEQVTDASDGLRPNLPAGQLVHALAPAEVGYFPTSHEMHATLPTEAPVAKPTLQVPEKPDRVTLRSDVNLTCMYPVDDVYSVPGLTEVPDSAANSFAEEQEVADEDDEHSLIVTLSWVDSVSKEEKEREMCKPSGAAMTQWQSSLLL